MHLIARRGPLAVILTLAVASSAVAAYYAMLTGFSPWDDEGNLMMTVRQFLDGGVLYRNVSTGYGPLYYFYNWLVRSLTSSPVTHDSTRITAAAVWTICALSGAGIVWTFGRSIAGAAIAWAVIFRTLSFFRNEPGHPQELCMMLLLAAAAAFRWCDVAPRRRSALAVAGALAAALLLVKINIGIFVALAIGLAILGHLNGQWIWRIALAATMVLPLAMMRSKAGDPREMAYAVAVTAGIAALVVRPAIRVPKLSWWDAVAAAAGFCCVLGCVLVVCVARGITLGSMAEALVAQQWRIRVGQLRFFIPVSVGVGWLVSSIAALATAAWVKRTGRTPGRISAVVGAVGLVAAAFPGNQALVVITPWCWLLTFHEGKGTLGRSMLASAAVLQSLYVYPVAGSQVPFAQVLLVVVAAVLVSDGLKLRAACAVVLLVFPVWAWQADRRYRALTPLDLPGASLVRIEARQADEYRWLVHMIERHCDTFVGYPGVPSLYAWTGKRMPGPADDPPGPLSTDSWNLWLRPEEEEAVAAEFSRHPNGCVIYNRVGVAFWNRSGDDESGRPLIRFIREHFKTVARLGDDEFQVRNERSWAVADTP